MKSVAALLLAAAAAFAASSAVPPSAKWTVAGTSQDTEQVTFSLALPMQNLDQLNAVFNAVSDPDSPQYGKYLSRDEVNKMTAAPKELRDEVIATMTAAGVTCVEKTGDSVICTAPVAKVNALLKTSLTAYKHKETGALFHMADGSHTFPESLVGKVNFISGLSMLPAEHYGRSQVLDLGGSSSTGAPQGSKLAVVPETLSALYNLDAGKGSSKVTQGAVEYQGAPAWSESDLKTFISNTGVPAFDVSHTGPFNTLQPFAESTLDIQYLGAVGTGNTNNYFTTSTWMYDYANEVLAGTFTADVQSSSYGYREDQNCVISPESKPCANGGVTAYINTTNALFQKVGATGITLVVAAGDAGAHGREDPSCISGKTNPDFPASSPYVTSVGATQLSTDAASSGAKSPICQSELKCATSGSEQVCSYGTGALITSGGGFSLYADRPSYQSAAVEAYLKVPGATPAVGDFNAKGRAYPDVAALGHAYYIELQGQAVAVDGTSCAAPVFSGVLGLLNAYRVESGGAKLGFANPLLYKMAAEHPAAFQDITVGSNKCTSFLCEGCTGFEAAKGWDAATGFGTPNLKEMLAYLQAKDGLAPASDAILDAAAKMQEKINKMVKPALRGVEGLLRRDN